MAMVALSSTWLSLACLISIGRSVPAATTPHHCQLTQPSSIGCHVYHHDMPCIWAPCPSSSTILCQYMGSTFAGLCHSSYSDHAVLRPYHTYMQYHLRSLQLRLRGTSYESLDHAKPTRAHHAGLHVTADHSKHNTPSTILILALTLNPDPNRTGSEVLRIFNTSIRVRVWASHWFSSTPNIQDIKLFSPMKLYRGCCHRKQLLLKLSHLTRHGISLYPPSLCLRSTSSAFSLRLLLSPSCFYATNCWTDTTESLSYCDLLCQAFLELDDTPEICSCL